MGKKGSRKKKFQPLEQWLTQQQSYPPQGWIDLPADLTENILQRLGPVEILETAQHVCATWRTVCGDPLMWRVIDMRYRFRRLCSCRRLSLYGLLRSTCRRAVDYSKGELIDINLEHFGDNDLLLYISDRSSHLRCLGIENCNSITGKGLTTAVAKLPELEELHMSYFYFSAEDIQTIGNCCPGLKSFTFRGHVPRGYRHVWRGRRGGNYLVDNRCALAIARNMPNLRRLDLSGNKALSDVGVKAILDGCQLLESIDLWGCFNVHFDKSIHDLKRSTAHSHNQRDDEDGYYSDASASYVTCCCDGSGDDYYHIHEEDEDEDEDDDDVDDLYSRFSMVLKDDLFSGYSKVRRPTKTLKCK